MTEKISVFSASELQEQDKQRIESVFRKKHKTEVEFVYTVDASLLGGLLIIDGNEYYDSTIASRLAKIKRSLL